MHIVSGRYRRLILALLVVATPLASTAGAQQQVEGLIVEEVPPASAGAKAGLKVGDRLLSYDGKPLLSPWTLEALEQNTTGKDVVAVEVLRAEQTLMLTVQVGTLGH